MNYYDDMLMDAVRNDKKIPKFLSGIVANMVPGALNSVMDLNV